MRRQRLLPLGFSLAPALLAGLLAWLIASEVLPNAVIVGRYEFDLAWLVSVAGLISSSVLVVTISVRQLVRRAAQQARQHEQATLAAEKKQFLRRLDHELKNPLTIVRLGITNLQDSPNLTTVQNASLNRMELQTQRLQKLVTDLRALTELEERELDKQPLDLRKILRDAVETSESDRPSTAIRIQFQEVPWPVGQVLGDRDLLVAAVRNLLDNAHKFKAEDGHVEVRVTDDGRFASIEIADRGIGIPAEEIEHVFNELYRGRNAQGVAGSGLGLTLVQRIVALHGGTIVLRSRESQGTVVTIQLPLASD